jgi:hypothetical protein
MTSAQKTNQKLVKRYLGCVILPKNALDTAKAQVQQTTALPCATWTPSLMLHKSVTAQVGVQKLASSCQRTPAVRIQCSSGRPAQPTHSASKPSQDRRSFLLQLAATATLLQAGPALADNGFVQWWKSRRSANGGAKLLNPLYVAQARLQEVGLRHLRTACLEAATSRLVNA